MTYAILFMIMQAWLPTVAGPQSRLGQSREASGSGHPELVQRCDPVLTALFTPPNPHVGHYQICTTDGRIDEVAEAGWTIESLDPQDAFGRAGLYDRGALARLYGGRRPRVARGWRQQGDRFESVTLISPYPEASLSHLNGGTMMIVFSVNIS
jgi:hypothetical protein